MTKKEKKQLRIYAVLWLALWLMGITIFGIFELLSWKDSHNLMQAQVEYWQEAKQNIGNPQIIEQRYLYDSDK